MPRRPLCSFTNPDFLSTRGSTGWHDSGDRVHQVKIPRTGRPFSFEQPKKRILLAKKGGIAHPAKQTIAELFLYDSDMDRRVQLKIAKGKYNISNPKSVVPINSWKALAKKMLSFSRIDHLVLSFHAYSGGMLIGIEAKDLDAKSVKKLFTNKKGIVTTKIEKIDIDGCNVAENPTRMARFAKWFAARQISAYTWSLVFQRIKIKFSKGNDEGEIKKILAPYRKFIISNLPKAATLAHRCKSGSLRIAFVIAYGSEDGTHATFPIPSRQEKYIKPLSSARERSINLPDVTSLQKEYDDSVIQSFEHVTIKLKGNASR
ncbi:uncharacterized protein Dvar_59910 [Desulfosarcina variabilis str. Montpellier]|uniref:hypothetical protein n=1 Tax=Desulfosarcina variabilis TaxID=2300 RepID=UPI003AFB07D6